MIPIHDFIPNPYDDKMLVYNKKFHRYSLNLEYFVQAIGDDEIITKLGGNDNAQWMLEHTSEVAYGVIDSYSDSKYRDKFRYYLSHSKRVREWLLIVMRDVLIYNETDGGLYTAYSTGINFNEMKAFDMILTNFVGRMAQQFIVNGGLAERVLRYDLDRITNEFYNLHGALDYMATKGYIDINDYYDRKIINSNSVGFNYNEIRTLFDENKFVAIQSPLDFTGVGERLYITHTLSSDKIHIQYEQGSFLELLNNNTVGGNAIENNEFYIDFKLQDFKKLVPNSIKYSLVPNGNGGYIVNEYGYWKQCLIEKGVNW